VVSGHAKQEQSLMPCRPSKVGRRNNLARHARVVCGVIAVAALLGSLFLSESPYGSVLAAAGAGLLVAVVLLPLLTEFEIDVLGIRAKALVEEAVATALVSR
jgi:hypothetical protein